ncbi:nuclear transport factor 2-like protein [Winogradskyella vidalii]|uniref:hypothetical protein n=1 Tax=Winogradskyella vidalii TaxID=2615024 RepID=UPI0015C815F8|nr:hypothetical protein [Winogradskyella vidalii]
MSHHLKPHHKLFTLFLLLALGFLSCKTSDNNTNQLKIAKTYYTALNTADTATMTTLVSDSIVIREQEDNYEERFSNAGYIQWLIWDAVFKPTYKVLELKQDGDTVKAKISKIDTRLLFLHEEPMVWYETIQFDNHQIKHVVRTTYEVFHLDKFLKNRSLLTNWINKNHPELNGFLQDQTVVGGVKYLKAIELYSNTE